MGRMRRPAAEGGPCVSSSRLGPQTAPAHRAGRRPGRSAQEGARPAEPPSVRTGGRAPAEHAGAPIRRPAPEGSAWQPRADPGRRSRTPTERACPRIRRPAPEGGPPVSHPPPAPQPPAARPARRPHLGRRAGRRVPPRRRPRQVTTAARAGPARPAGVRLPLPRRVVRRQAPERGRLPFTATLGGEDGLPTHDSAARGRGVSRALSTRARRNSPARRYALRLPGPGARHRGARTRRGGRAGRAGPGPTRPGDVVASGPRPEAQ